MVAVEKVGWVLQSSILRNKEKKMSVVKVNKEEFLTVINNDMVLVDFFAEWCGPCKILGPTLEQVAEELKNVDIVKIDVDDHLDIAQLYDISGVPTMILFKKGKKIDQKVGFAPKDTIIGWLKNHM